MSAMSHIANAPLSPRQLEVLGYLFVGKTNIEIGQCIGATSLTVKNHVQRIIAKLCANNRQHAVYRGLCMGILKVPTSPDEVPKATIPAEVIPPVTDWLQVGDIALSVAAHKVKVGDKPAPIRGVLFDLLFLLMKAGERVSRYESLIARLFRIEKGSQNALSVHRVRLQRELEAAGSSYEIACERGVGYRLQAKSTVEKP